MSCIIKNMKVGDKIRVVRNSFSLESYPWIPDLIGKTGVITDIQYEECHVVKMDKPFKVHRPLEGEHAYGFIPDMALAEKIDKWAFLTDCLEVIHEN